jgi:hypothetical protein
VELWRARAFWHPKDGNAISEWEDAGAFSEARGLFAVADGATSSYRAQAWAYTLVRRFLDAPPSHSTPEAFAAWLEGARNTMPADDASSENAAWYVGEAARRGSFATLVGLALARPDARRPRAGSWRALAFGDSCLFQIRAGELLVAFPLREAASFGMAPPLLRSIGHHNGDLEDLKFAGGRYQTGDVFLLATDALSAWALQTAESEPAVWKTLARVGHEAFAQLLIDVRAADAIENDDVTLLQVRIS